MADVIKSSRTLQLVAGFNDGDDRTLNLENPINGISAANINALSTYASGVLIGDQNQAAFQGFKSAKVINRTVTKLDLSA